MKSLIVSIRLVVVTLSICVAAYVALILGLAQAFAPGSAKGSLVRGRDGHIIGSSLIAQKFTQPHYFWPRPSAVDYNGAGAGGSNKSPTSPELAERAKGIIAQYGSTADNPLPAELAAASGGGLDPHITEQAAMYQAERVAKARSLPQSRVEGLIRQRAFTPGAFLTPDRLVNVLELNLAVDALH